MFRPLQGVDSSISIGRIERIYESLKVPRGFILSRFKTLKYFWQALKYFYIMSDNLDTTTGTLSSDTATGVRVNCLYHIFSQEWNARNKQTNFDF